MTSSYMGRQRSPNEVPKWRGRKRGMSRPHGNGSHRPIPLAQTSSLCLDHRLYYFRYFGFASCSCKSHSIQRVTCFWEGFLSTETPQALQIYDGWSSIAGQHGNAQSSFPEVLQPLDQLHSSAIQRHLWAAPSSSLRGRSLFLGRAFLANPNRSFYFLKLNELGFLFVAQLDYVWSSIFLRWCRRSIYRACPCHSIRAPPN